LMNRFYSGSKNPCKIPVKSIPCERSRKSPRCYSSLVPRKMPFHLWKCHAYVTRRCKVPLRGAPAPIVGALRTA
jgi:hypothetical protein